ITALFRLYDDTNPNALSIPRVVRSLQSEPNVPRAVAKQAWAGLQRVKPSVTKIRHLRDKLFAHRDRQYTYERAFDEAGLTPDEGGPLTEDTLVLINDLLRVRDKGTFEFDHGTERDLLRLLKDLHSLRAEPT